MKFFILIVLVSISISCTSAKYSKDDLRENFGGTNFSLIKPMYVIYFWKCGIFGKIEEKSISVMRKAELVSKDNIALFDGYLNTELGDNNCSINEDIRVYNLLPVGQSVELVSARDRLDTASWVWDTKGYVMINGRRTLFRLELPYQKGALLKKSLAEVFLVEK